MTRSQSDHEKAAKVESLCEEVADLVNEIEDGTCREMTRQNALMKIVVETAVGRDAAQNKVSVLGALAQMKHSLLKKWEEKDKS